MACSCQKKRDEEIKTIEKVDEPETITPTTQCIACAQKHLDEAWTMFNEHGYSNENRRFVRGNLRAIVLHTFKDWKEIADLSRKCALLMQEAKDDEARPLMCRLCDMVDKAFLEANPDVKRRILEIQHKEVK